jgi:hypothetical protein
MQEGMLQAANEVLQEKVPPWAIYIKTFEVLFHACHGKQLTVWIWYCVQIVEQSSLLDVGMVVADQQNGHFSTVPLVEEMISNPLTILSGYSNCRGYSFWHCHDTLGG